MPPPVSILFTLRKRRWRERWRLLELATLGSMALLCFFLASGDLATKQAVAAEPTGDQKTLVRVGIIGLDTSHAIAFTQILNDPQAPKELSGCRVVAVFPQNSPDIAEALESAAKVMPQMEQMGIDSVDSVDALLQRVDVVLLETNDGRRRLEQIVPVLKAGKPVFADKPVAASLADVIAVYKLAARYETPIFSSSSLRFTDGSKEILAGKVGSVVGCETFSPGLLERTHPDFFWYGIHGVEPLITLMGTGCESVVRVSTPNTDVVVGKWKDGRIGSFRGRRKDDNGYLGGYGGTVFGSKGVQQVGGFSGYEPLLVEVVRFFKTRKPPVSAEETIEIYAFMEAADESKRRGGVPVKLADVLQKAKQKAAARIESVTAQVR